MSLLTDLLCVCVSACVLLSDGTTLLHRLGCENCRTQSEASEMPKIV